MDNLHVSRNEVVVAFCPDYSVIHHTPGITSDPAVITDKLQAEERKIVVIIEKLREKLTKTGVTGRILSLTGQPGPALVKAADDEVVNYIVTGTRGMSTIRRTLMGSVSDYIVHHSHVPVLVCPRPKEK